MSKRWFWFTWLGISAVLLLLCACRVDDSNIPDNSGAASPLLSIKSSKEYSGTGNAGISGKEFESGFTSFPNEPMAAGKVPDNQDPYSARVIRLNISGSSDAGNGRAIFPYPQEHSTDFQTPATGSVKNPAALSKVYPGPAAVEFVDAPYADEGHTETVPAGSAGEKISAPGGSVFVSQGNSGGQADTEGDAGNANSSRNSADNDESSAKNQTQPVDSQTGENSNCPDADNDGCNDCAYGEADTANDGPDEDRDGLCDAGDDDDDGDGVADKDDSAPLNRLACSDIDGDNCDDCSSGGFDVANDGPDLDSDQLCDAGDDDMDGDGVANSADSDPENRFACSDKDLDGCDDCLNGNFNLADDGTDTDGDGWCDQGDNDDDNDCVADASDTESLNPLACADTDLDCCDDCAGGVFDPQNDGADTDGDGICDAAASTAVCDSGIGGSGSPGTAESGGSGGIGGTGDPVTLIAQCGGSGGIGGSGVPYGNVTTTGVITGFGSVFVNGVEFFTEQAEMELNDVPDTHEYDLKIGMIVDIKGRIDQNGLTGMVEKLVADFEVQGEIEDDPEEDPDNIVKTFSVLNKTVIVNRYTTIFHSKNDRTGGVGFDSIDEHDYVSVTGYMDREGKIYATFVEQNGKFLSDGSREPSRVSIKGMVHGFDGLDQFKIDDIRIFIGPETEMLNLPAEWIFNGLELKVYGYLNSSGSIRAVKIKALTNEAAAPATPTPVRRLMEGLVTDIDKNESFFRLNGKLVNFSGVKNPYFDLREQMHIELWGEEVDGVVYAESIRLRKGYYEISGMATYNDPVGEIIRVEVVKGQEIEVHIDSRTIINNIRNTVAGKNVLGTIMPGDFVEIQAMPRAAGGLIANVLKKQNLRKQMSYMVTGDLTALDSGTHEITVLNTRFATTDSTRFEVNDMDVGSYNEFIKIMQSSDQGIVTVKDTRLEVGEYGDGIADEVELSGLQ